MRRPRLALRPAHAPAAPAVYAETFERVPESAAAARHLVCRALEVWRLQQLDDTAALVMTELVSNAVRHASGEGMRVNVQRLDGHRVRVSVLDRSRKRPAMRDQGLDEVGGRGLVIINEQSASWGVDLLPGGKRVWAELEAGR